MRYTLAWSFVGAGSPRAGRAGSSAVEQVKGRHVNTDGPRRWVGPIIVLAAAVFSAVTIYGGRSEITAVAMGSVMTWYAWWISPLRRGRHVGHRQARSRAGDDDVIVYWRPGCSYCIRLLWRIDRGVRDDVHWVNIWQDDEAAAFVASLHDGDQVTPTAITGSGRQLSATADAIVSYVRSAR